MRLVYIHVYRADLEIFNRPPMPHACAATATDGFEIGGKS